jgi:hypothetical protein
MSQTLNISPILWVIPEDLFRVSCPSQIQEQIRSRFGCETWVLDDGRALAYCFRDLLANQGVPLDYGLYLERARPLSRSMDSFLLQDRDALDLRIPGGKYWVRVSLQPGEVDKRHCMHIQSRLTSLERVALRAYATSSLAEPRAAQIKMFLLHSIDVLNKVPINGETLRTGNIEIERYEVPQSTTCYGEDGFEISMQSYQPVTWPWLELYLRIRRTFPKRERLSFEFIDKVQRR